MTNAPRQADYRPLLAPVADSEASAFRRAWLSGAFGPAEAVRDESAKRWIMFGLLVPFAVVPLFVLAGFAFPQFPGASIVIVLLVAAVVAVIVVAILRRGLARWRPRAALDRFARANGLGSQPLVPGPSYPGLLFDVGSGRTVGDRVFALDGRFFDIGNYTFVTSNGKQSVAHPWHYLALRLDRRMPHFVLDAKADDLIGSNLPAGFGKNQVLSLEGDFDRVFTLYCPEGYERDALYVFTPDLMELLMREVPGWNVEVVDEWVFLFGEGHFRPLAPETWERLFRVVGVVGPKLLSRTSRYRDERLVPPGADPLQAFSSTPNLVTRQGWRLRRWR
ncbi:hypothetical protein ET445_07585 [Agromyces protaetiae]|uniref:DUF3137 domain-containing protein n=1 Tax=Agromyces protaetiae TaxID=2509455 RepID=A0A4P6FFN4_9MICO|nr:hypothetical protein [Agromyces protaetiae]QAY73229.1 hypothetical protein ET445_07585 [Agromyces protaetiae]